METVNLAKAIHHLLLLILCRVVGGGRVIRQGFHSFFLWHIAQGIAFLKNQSSISGPLKHLLLNIKAKHRRTVMGLSCDYCLRINKQ